MGAPVPDDSETALPTWVDPALVKALARAFRYQRLTDGRSWIEAAD